ncbi:MAG: cation diffusion facilitator family transporter [Microbacterium sp.]
MHDHAHGGRGADNRRLLVISLGLTGAIFVVQLIGAFVTGSLALLADAVHMLTDAIALVVALIASAVAARPADDRRTYGYQRAEVLGALLNAIILVALCVSVAIQGVQRLISAEPHEVLGGWMLVIAVFGLVANAVSMWILSSAQRHSMNVRGAYLEVMGDLIGSVIVIVAAIVILLTGWTKADAIGSLVIAVLIVPRAIGLLREVIGVLAESTPAGTSVDTIREHILAAPGVTAVHDVHVWQLTRGNRVFTAHVVVSQEVWDARRAGGLLATLQSCLAEHFDVAHSTFQFEPAGHADATHR